MQMGPISSTGIAGRSEDIPFVHDISGFDFHAFKVRVAGFETEIMLNDDTFAAEF